VTSTDHQPGVALPATSGNEAVDDRVDGWGPEPDVRVLDRAECLELLAGTPIGQLVFTYQAMPDILPVNVAVADDVLLIPFTDGSLIERAARNTVVAFHADRIDEVTHLGWSVTVVGRSFELRDGDAPAGRPVARPRSWMPGRHDRTLAVALERVTGRRLVPATT
jgi:nitroimidazol reductase NimA-like FMN-containing flavoprotein (pyridoxamine 5'-phosphate oxidase superfamily)